MEFNVVNGLKEEIEIKIAYKNPIEFYGYTCYFDWIEVETMKDVIRILAGDKGYSPLWDKYVSLTDNEIPMSVDGDEIKEIIIKDGIMYIIIGTTQYLYDIFNDEIKSARV